MSRPPLFSARYFADLAVTAGARRERRPFPLPGSTPRYARDRVVDIRHIRLDLSFDFAAKTVVGSCTTTLQPINDGVEHVEFDAVELTVHAVRRGDAPLLYTHDGRKLIVALDRPCNSGEEMTIVI